MAFGAELKDFVAGFQSGYQLIESPEEKERKRAAEARAQGSYEREGKWHDEESARKAKEWDYGVSQDTKAEGWKRREFDYKVNTDRYQRAEDADKKGYNRGRDAIEDARKERQDLETKRANDLKRDELRLERMRRAIESGDVQDNGQVQDMQEEIKRRKAAEAAADKESMLKSSESSDDLTGSRSQDTLGGNDTMDGGGWREPQAPQEIAQQLVHDLQNEVGMTREAAIGVVGQLGHESGGFRSLQELNPMVKGSRGGWGYAQWTGPRRREFEAFAKQNGFDPRSYAANYEFLKYELMNTREGNVLKGLRNIDDSRQAGRYFTDRFLRPGIPGYGSRDRWTDRIASLYSSRGGMIHSFASGGFAGGLAEGFNASKAFTEDDEDDEDENLGKAIPDDTTDDDYYPVAPRRVASSGGWGAPSAWKVNTFADGGYVTGIPEDEVEQARLAEEELIRRRMQFNGMNSEGMDQAPDDGATMDITASELPPNIETPDQTAIPETEDEVTSQSKTEEPATEEKEEAPSGLGEDYDRGRKAALKAWKKAEEDFAKENPETGIEDPELEERYMNYKNGYGAAPHQMMKQVLDTIDPNHEMSPSERNVKAMGYVVRYYEDRGDSAKAQEAAKSMLQYYRESFNKFSAISKIALEEGDLDTATQGAIAAYAQIPNGKDLAVEQNEDGSLTVSVTDQKTGKLVKKQVMNPTEFAAAAAQMHPGTFDDAIMAMAGVEGEKIETTDVKAGSEDSQRFKESMDDAYGSIFATEDSEDKEGNQITANPDAAFMDTAKQKTLKSAAKSLMSVKGNNMDAAEALDFLDPTSPEPFGRKNKPGRPGYYEVKRGGITKIMNEEQYDKVVSDWKRIQRQKAKNTADAEAKTAKEAADAADPNRQTDISGAAQRTAANILGGGTRRPMPGAVEPEKEVPAIAPIDITGNAVDMVTGTKRPIPGEREPIVEPTGREPAVTTAIPEETGLIDQRLTPSKPASDIAKFLTGTSIERLNRQRQRIQADVDRMRGQKEYQKVIPKRVAELRAINAEIGNALRSEIAALEDAARSVTPGTADTTNYRAEIDRRKQALADHEKQVIASTK